MVKPKISIISAIGKNRELGKNNSLLWNIKADMKHFKDLTEGHVVIMGRKTYESLPEKFRPLPNRVNIVVTRDPMFTISARSYQDSNLKVFVCHSIEEAIEITNDKSQITNKFQILNFKPDEIFIIGGASIYTQGIKYADKLYLTLIDKAYPDADAFFPDFSEFKNMVSEKIGKEGELTYKFIELKR